MTSLTLSGGWIGDGYDVFAAVPLLHLSDNFGADETGLGDIVVRVGRSNLYHTTEGLTLGASVSIKLPAADESKNLGSGETDIGGFVNLRKQWSSFDTTMGAGYLVVGDPAGTDYNNVTFLSIGIAKQLPRGGMFASLDGRSAVITGTDAPRELGFGGYYVVNAQHAFSISAFMGLSGGSADYGLNLGWLRRF
ncbi:MAG: transporter [Gammaproteobacteria bacterium]|nr:transporter [Gammaproteobacteria bacterium]